MDTENLKKFVELAKTSGVTELEYESSGVRYYVNLGHVGTSQQIPVFDHRGIATNSAKHEPKLEHVKQYLEIKSPFVGTFYRSSSPQAASFVKVGDRVSKGSVLCIVEAMKIMNEIESEFDGEVIEICVENENYVEYGQLLFKIKA